MSVANQTSRPDGIFVVTASGKPARRSIARSIAQPLAADVAQRLSDAPSPLYAWQVRAGDRNERRFRLLRDGDWVLFVWGMRYRYAARVVRTLRDREFARAAWPDDTEAAGDVILLDEPLRVDGAVADFAAFLPRLYLGFSHIAERNVDEVRRRYGSVSAWIRTLAPEGRNAPRLMLADGSATAYAPSAEGYLFGQNHPNYTKITAGTQAVLQRSSDGVRHVFARVTIGSVEDFGGEPGRAAYLARYAERVDYPFAVRVEGEVLAALQEQPEWNPQHGINLVP